MHDSRKENINSKGYAAVMQPRMKLANQVHTILKEDL
jgi:hypothetical protein